MQAALAETWLRPADLSAMLEAIEADNLGKPETILPGLNAAGLEGLIPNATYETVAEATQYSSFSECTAKGALILQSEGDNAAICTDGGEQSRTEIHRQLAEKYTDSFHHTHLGRIGRATAKSADNEAAV